MFTIGHICGLYEEEYLQMAFHESRVMSQDSHGYLRDAEWIEVPVLLVNGELDDYTGAVDAREFSQLIDNCAFARIADAGHFLDAENKQAWADTRDAVMGFLLPVERAGFAGSFQGLKSLFNGNEIGRAVGILGSG